MYLWLQRDGDQKAFSVWVWSPGSVYSTDLFWGVHKALPVQLLWTHPWARERGSQAQQLLIKVIVPRPAITTQKIPLSISSGISCFCNADVSKRFICGHLLITFTSVYCFRWTGREADTGYWLGQHPVITRAAPAIINHPVLFSECHKHYWWQTHDLFPRNVINCMHGRNDLRDGCQLALPVLWQHLQRQSLALKWEDILVGELIDFHLYRITNNPEDRHKGPPFFITYPNQFSEVTWMFYFKFRETLVI